LAITAKLVKELREMTGAGMMDCKKALVETDGVIEEAVDILREKGLAKAAKKSGRIAAEGISVFAISKDGKTGATLELNSETDFVAKNEDFKGFANAVAEMIVENDFADIEAVKAAKCEDGKTVAEALSSLIAKIGENMSLRRFEKVTVSQGLVTGYLHGEGKIAVLVGLESEAAQDQLAALGKDLAMQVAAMNPKYIRDADVDQEYLAHEKEVLMQQALNEGKPAKIVEKMVAGRLKKELKEICLVDQAFVKDSDLSVEQLIKNTAKTAGADITIKAVSRLAVGEGLEKKEEDFAAEVAAQMKK